MLPLVLSVTLGCSSTCNNNEVGHYFEYVLLSFAFPTRIGLLYLAFITYLAVFSVVFCFIYAGHATRSELEMDTSPISHIRNA